MGKESDRELEEPETWEFARPEVRQPVKTSRAVVSVAFRRDDFAVVSEYAQRHGMRVSEFIREAAMEKAGGGGARTPLVTSSIGASFWIGQVPAYTLTVGQPVESLEEAPASTY